ncbi:3-oxoacyl-[acyl-carrier-protein] synthase III C-terminal domain-containing protein [Cupriavidus basilensis]|uniref:3-oxoacyl-[acyl-carrier-protein] synthase III C-terminal domain-containing protein n=1 Tax=Cupriavidus basilensis TaxID=68895 RepID=UPI0039F68272
MLPLRILATGKALPARQVTSAELDKVLGKAAGYVRKTSGIDHRYHAGPGETQSALAAAALRDAMARGGIAPGSIGLVISAAGVQEQALPCTGARLLEAAGIPAGTPAFDVNASCLSFLAALQVAASLLHSGTYRRIAVVASDLASRGLDWSQPEASLIFGDGAAAAVVERGDGSTGIEAYRMETYPAGKAFCEIRAGGTRTNPRMGARESDFLFHMEGKRVFKLASTVMDAFLASLLDAGKLRLAEIDVVVPHQASHLAMRHIGRRLGVPAASVVDIYRAHGNQVAASLPTALHEAMRSGRAGAGSRALLLGTAAGLTVGAMVLRL